jgi:hypothetical protein
MPGEERLTAVDRDAAWLGAKTVRPRTSWRVKAEGHIAYSGREWLTICFVAQ